VRGAAAAARAGQRPPQHRLPGRSLPGMSVIEIRDLHVEYRRRGRPPVAAVAGASLSVQRGQIVGLVGESGCGKSTLAQACVGLTVPARGTVLFEGRPVAPLTRTSRPAGQQRLQMVFQNPFGSLNPRRRIGSQIADGLRIADVKGAAARTGRITEVLQQVGLAPAVADRFPHEFSGGQRQRIAIARALAAAPSAIVLDEPLSSLDASAQAQLANLLMELRDELGVGMLLISHDLGIVHQIADLVAVMYLGQVVETATTAQLWDSPLHPYSRALIASIPRADGAGNLPAALPGEVPDPARPPAGCRFHPRCPVALDRCRTEAPPLLSLGDGRAAACWLAEPGLRADGNVVVSAPEAGSP
jgi:oligopeptide/dipeptide ABC transporter ATP-binding protein